MKIDLSRYDELSTKQWKEKVVYRGLHIKYKYQLLQLKKLYPEKIGKLQDRFDLLHPFTLKITFQDYGRLVEIYGLDFCLDKKLAEIQPIIVEEIEYLESKIERLIDKYGATLKEIELRDNKLVKRNPRGTIYYIDLDAGDDGLDGLTTGNAWLTLNKYTTVESRSPGDVAKVRANTSQVFAADLVFDEDGHVDNGLITIKGCSIADDPWGDASDVKPILDFNDTTEYLNLTGDDYWKFQNLDFKGGNSPTYGCVHVDSDNTFFDNCRFYENGDKGLNLYSGNRPDITSCEFYSNIDENVTLGAALTNPIFKNCTFNGGTDTTDTGIYCDSEIGFLILIDCSFGQTTAHDNEDILLNDNSHIIMRNCKYNSINYGLKSEKGRRVYLEDDGQVFEAHKVDNYDVLIERDTAVTRPGGADSSLKMTPSSRVGLYNKVSSCGEQGEIVRGTFKIWLQADVEKTINIYIKGFGWTGFPTAAQLFLRASYLSNAGTAERTELDSDETISDNTTWVPFQVTLTPARTGFVYLDVFIAHYEASSGINIDIDTSNIT